jgi:hypothetical protein
MPDYPAVRASTLRNVTGGGTGAGQSFAGQADDSFFLDLRIFDLLYGGDLSETGQDTLDGYNVQTIALKVPKASLALNANATRNPVIGVWSTTSRPTTRVLPATNAGTFRTGAPAAGQPLTQVSRLGNPLVNEVVIPVRDKDKFNRSQPADDGANFLPYVQSPEVPKLIEAIYKVPAPATPREDLVEVFLTGVCKAASGCPGSVPALEADLNSQLLNQDVVKANFKASEMLRLNMNVPATPASGISRLGVLGNDLNGFPNGRRLFDDVVDIELKVLEGALTGAKTDVFTDGVNANDVPFTNTFPYVAQPHQRAVNRS